MFNDDGTSRLEREGAHRPTVTNRAAVRRWLTAAAVVAVAALLGPAAIGAGTLPAEAATASPASSASAGADSDSPVPTMLILDASGSMKAKDGDSKGGTRMAAAKKAAKKLVNGLSDDSQLGLTVYGANTGSSDGEKAKGCKDVDVVAPVKSGNAKGLKKGINSAKASGYTPIGKSLRKAADELPKSGDRAVVLVSDGIDTCAPPPPCDVAKDLKKKGVDLTVHTIGFRVGKDARKDLSCIAKSTGGEYSDAQDGGQLSDQLEQRTTRAMEGYEVSGDPIKGGDRVGNAPTVKPGQYLDTLEKGSKNLGQDGSEKFYAVDVSKGERIHASATVVPPAGSARWTDAGSLNTSIDVEGQNGTSCADKNSATGTGEGPSSGGDTPQAAGVNSKPVKSESAESSVDNADLCPEGKVYLHVKRTGAIHKNTPFPVELVVAKEVAGAVPSGSPAPTTVEDTQGAKPVAPSNEEPVKLGRSFSKATAVKPGSFVTELVPGDVRLVKIPVHEGQRLRYRIEAAGAKSTSYTNLRSTKVNLNVFNPLRMAVRPDAVSRTESFSPGSGNVLAGGLPAETRAANRDVDSQSSKNDQVADNWLGGGQYVMLNASRLTGAKKSEKVEPVRVQVTLEVDGQAGKDVNLTASHNAPTNSAVNDQGKAVSDDSDGGEADDSASGPISWSPANLGRTTLVFGAIGAGVVAIAAAIGAVLLFRRRR